jgi:hypothetical protein
MKVVISLLLAFLLQPSLCAKPKGPKHHKHAPVVVVDDVRYFRSNDIVVIRDYYKPSGLPPGLEKKLYRTGRLPPGWEKKVRPFPAYIETQLPPPCGGCSRGYIDGYAVVYNPGTRVIVDVQAVFNFGR